MREIKFKAKKSNGECWIYGSLISYSGTHSIYVNEDSCQYDVVSETIGQFTGLKDKNGVDIYEGDIVNHTFYNHSTPNVKFKQECYFDNGCFCLRTIGKEHFPVEQDRNNVPIFWCLAPNVIEIIGNIHQNPELL